MRQSIFLQQYMIQKDLRSPKLIERRLSWWLSGKESACQYRDVGLIPGWGRSPGEGNGEALQYFCLGNPMDRGAWWATVYGGQKV